MPKWARASSRRAVSWAVWARAAADRFITGSLGGFSFSVIISARFDSSSHGRRTASRGLFKMENSWEAPAEIRLSAARHLEWPDLLSLLTKNVHNHDDKREPNSFYLILSNSNSFWVLELNYQIFFFFFHSWNNTTELVHSHLSRRMLSSQDVIWGGNSGFPLLLH